MERAWGQQDFLWAVASPPPHLFLGWLAHVFIIMVSEACRSCKYCATPSMCYHLHHLPLKVAEVIQRQYSVGSQVTCQNSHICTNLFCICLKHYWLKPSMAINTCVLRNKRFLNIHIDVPPCWKVKTECFLYKSEHWQIWSLRIPYKHKETDVTNTIFHEDYAKNKISHNIHFFSWLRSLQQCFKSHLN